jgi:hypothetical protein
MLRFTKTVAMVLATLLLVFVPPILATEGSQQNVVSRADLEQAVAQRLQQDDSSREAIRELLRRPEVRKIAAGAGLDLKRAEAAVATLEGPELERVAEQAAQADEALAGGTQTITISTVGLLLIIIIILIIKM